ncbi:hypothetical protein GMOD_00009968 [Pyrenophora seminiperda CCB06]|uniref:Uncharacterized protein n=1 Tax=Pyrenophora seminiperda CCB06 TaxID=1302712 RepID=A0A3M7M1J3_9PLEO|nr:hypothetical protein GMOD_00009968 [Pyrenophora seminiperda CCB06]
MSEKRLLRQRRHPRPMPRLTSLIIPTRIMNRDSIIPKRRRPRCPPEAHLNVNILLVNIKEVVEKDVAFSLVKSNNAVGKRAVHPECFPSRRRMHTNEWVDALDVFWTGTKVVTVEVGVRATVHGFSTVDDLSESRRKFLIRGVARGPERVTPDLWNGVVVQMRYTTYVNVKHVGSLHILGRLPSWLAFMHQIRVPPGRSARPSKASRHFCGLEIRPENSHARYSWYKGDLRLFSLACQLYILIRTIHNNNK